MLTQSCRKSSTKHCYLLMCNRISFKKIDKHQAVSKLLSTSEWEPIFNIHKQCKTFISFKKQKRMFGLSHATDTCVVLPISVQGVKNVFFFFFCPKHRPQWGTTDGWAVFPTLLYVFSLFLFFKLLYFSLSFFFQLLYMHALLLNCLY